MFIILNQLTIKLKNYEQPKSFSQAVPMPFIRVGCVDVWIRPDGEQDI